MTTVAEFEQALDSKTKVYQVYLVLRDQQWHCRECEYAHTGITQIAGGSGIQGLQRGTKSRPGITIHSDNHLCPRCERKTRQDRWDGGFESSVNAPTMSAAFSRRVAALLGSRDIVEGTERPLNQLTIDHKIPMIRWNAETTRAFSNYSAMDDDAIRASFQLLKKSNGSLSHNLLKSRACERCYQTGKRGKPFNINFYYAGDETWGPADRKDPSGCEGCGWYDVDEWRTHLNARLKSPP